jgi:hypothetical protein
MKPPESQLPLEGHLPEVVFLDASGLVLPFALWWFCRESQTKFEK